MGATRAVNVLQDDLDAVKPDLKIREGFDIGLEMSGVPSAFNTMIDHIRHGGRISLLGLLPDDTLIPWTKVIFKGLMLKGIYGREMFDTWYKMDAMVHAGLDLSPLITHRMPYTDYEEGFQQMIGGDCGKVILEWTE